MCSDKLPPKRLLDHLDTSNVPEPPRLDRTNHLPHLLTEPQRTANANQHTRKFVRGMVLLSRRSKQFAGMIDRRVNNRSDLGSPRRDSKLGGQMAVDLLGVKHGSARVVDRDLEVSVRDLLKESCESRDQRLK